MSWAEDLSQIITVNKRPKLMNNFIKMHANLNYLKRKNFLMNYYYFFFKGWKKKTFLKYI